MNIVVIGKNGQVARALAEIFPEARFAGRDEIDLEHPDTIADFDFRGADWIINAVGYTTVDKAEIEPDRAMRVNGTSVGDIVDMAQLVGARLVHYSSEYVFDGNSPVHGEDEKPNPLSAYGRSKVVGDEHALSVGSSLVIRPTWVIGDGGNFVRTMIRLARENDPVPVVDDQFGRLTFAPDLAIFTKHLISSEAAPGLYNLTSEGDITSWYDVAREVFRLVGADISRLVPVTTEQYAEGKSPFAPRPRNSTLLLNKAKSTGFSPPDWRNRTVEYVDKEQQ